MKAWLVGLLVRPLVWWMYFDDWRHYRRGDNHAIDWPNVARGRFLWLCLTPISWHPMNRDQIVYAILTLCLYGSILLLAGLLLYGTITGELFEDRVCP